MKATRSLVDDALGLAARGWRVFPVLPGQKEPAVKDWPNKATTDPATIEAWWTTRPAANIGLRTGGGFFVLDVDPRHGGDESLRALEAKYGVLPETVHALTPSGGDHFYFVYPPGADIRNSVGLVGSGLDIRGEGGFVVAPPSVRADGSYTWEVSGHPEDVAIAEPPAWLLDLLQTGKHPADSPTAEGGPIREGKRNSTLTSLAGTMQRKGMTTAAIEAALLAENDARCRPPLSEEEVRGIAASVGRYPAEPAAAPEHLTDAGNARRLVRLHGEDLHYTRAMGWLVWDGRRWHRDEAGAVMEHAKATVRDLYTEASATTPEASRKALAAHALRSEAEPRLRAMIALATTEPGIPAAMGAFNPDPWLLNCQNGTVDLRTGHLRPHDRADRITTVCPVAYDPAAAAPRWTRFLTRIFNGDAELIGFMQRACGYALTGDTSEQVMFVLYGLGANGKTTFIETLAALLGEYAVHTRTETLLAKRFDAIPNDVAALYGSRLVYAVEAEHGKRLAEALVKQLVGGDTVTARYLHRDFFSFRPTFKLWLATNHKPRITGTDHAIWRRIRLVPFDVVIPDGDQDKHLGLKLRAELPGILTWAVAGSLQRHREGLGQPAAVLHATAAYRTEQDALAPFVEDCCHCRPEASVSKTDLYHAYAEWAKAGGERLTLSKREFGQALKERGITEDRTGTCRLWLGIQLKAEAAAEPEEVLTYAP